MTRVVLVHERFSELGGSEKVVAELADIWPEGRLFTPIADRGVLPPSVAGLPITVSALQRFYRSDGRYSHLLPLLPTAMARADLSDAELVVLSHHAFSNRVRVPDGVPSLSYVHSPARWVWDPELLELEAGGRLSKTALGFFARSQRGPDRRAAQKITRLVANSATVAERIERWWGRTAEVIPPPVDVEFYRPDPTVEREDFVLLAGRLVPYKRPELAVAAAARAGVPMVVAGTGRSLGACRAAAGPETTFLADVPDSEMRELFRRCRALVFPGVEDFGMVPVEAQACGAPVVGVAAGGLTETVVNGSTGILVTHDSDPQRQIESLATVIGDLATQRFDHAVIRRQAERFGADVFRKSIETTATRLLS